MRRCWRCLLAGPPAPESYVRCAARHATDPAALQPALPKACTARALGTSWDLDTDFSIFFSPVSDAGLEEVLEHSEVYGSMNRIQFRVRIGTQGDYRGHFQE
ncbi:UNVERIFIED_CONTAM: hypothetical protein K2H54_043276 [Gekko kuhli]